VQQGTDAVEISVVVPVYGCAGCLKALHTRLTEVLSQLGVSYELVLVDDRSLDGGWDILRDIAQGDDRVVAIRLSRNFGQHPAITAGLEQARGNWIVVMDCDLQHPPEEIPRLYALARQGYAIVFAARRGAGHSTLRRLLSRGYFSVMNLVLKTDMNSDFSNFSIISRAVRDAFVRIKDKDRQYLMILYWLGFTHTTIEFQHTERYAGNSTYSLRHLVRFALAGLFFQTTLLLRWIVYAGFALSAAGVGLAAFFIYNYFFSNPYPGWTSLGVLLLVIGGFIIVSTGVAGLYVGAIFAQTKDRPLYVVETKIVSRPELAPGLVGESDALEVSSR
jgi:dolichol-phosphate mannosyltransferase